MTRRAFLALVLVAAACAGAPLVGTDLQKRTAPDFTLIDGATSDTVSLSQLRGTVVVLSFLYTQCPDTCPLTAEKLRDARASLGSSAADLALVAVSVDPDRDTPAATRDFLAAHRLSGDMRFLIGDRASLGRAWTDYAIFTRQNGTTIEHNDAIYLIDKQGRERSLLHSDVDVDALVESLRSLLGENRLF